MAKTEYEIEIVSYDQRGAGVYDRSQSEFEFKDKENAVKIAEELQKSINESDKTDITEIKVVNKNTGERVATFPINKSKK